MVFTEHGERLSGKSYFVSPDGALREGPENDKPRLPAFPSNQARSLEDMLNPFLVVLNAEIAFRRFRRKSRPLCAEYTELVDLTIELVSKIYNKPLVDEIMRDITKLNVAYSLDKDGDADMEGTVDEFGMNKGVDNVTITQKQVGKGSRAGGVVKKPGVGASHDDVIAYRQYLMSGCGRPFLFPSPWIAYG